MVAVDVLELLLPEAEPATLERARRLVTCLRLLRDDAAAARAETVQVDLARARARLDDEERARLVHALESVASAWLARAAGPESFLLATLPRADEDLAPHWALLLEMREREPALPSLPLPSESPVSVCARLVDALGALARQEREAAERADALDARAAACARAHEERHRLWSARLERVRGGPRGGEAAFREALRRCAPARRAGGAEPALRAGLAACLLDRGAVLEARALLAPQLAPAWSRVRGGSAAPAEGPAAEPGAEERVLARLSAWCALACGGVEEARAQLERAGTQPIDLPTPLVELRERLPQWLPYLAGRALAAPAPELPDAPVHADRATRLREALSAARLELGAAALACFRFDPAGGARALALEVAPGLRDDAPAWALERAACAFSRGEPEHLVLVEGHARIEHLEERGEPLERGKRPAGGRARALSPRCLARAWWPLVRGDGRVLGWWTIELEHHLVPSRARLAALGRLGLELVQCAEEDGLEPESRRTSGGRAGEAPAAAPLELADGPLRVAFERAVEASGFKVGQRLWWGFVPEDEARDGLRLVAHGGKGSGYAGQARGRGLALERAARAGGERVWSEPEPGLALHAASGSGLVVPLRRPGRGGRGRVEGWWVVESSRRRDLGAADLARIEGPAHELALVLALARFSLWHERQHGHSVLLEPTEPGLRERLPALFALAEGRAPVVLTGPSGAGKLVLARLLHHSGRRPGTPCVELDARAASEGDALHAALERARCGSLLLRGLERARRGAREALAAWLERTRGDLERARLIVTRRSERGESAPDPSRGEVERELASDEDELEHVLGGLCVRVPGLARRRAAIAPLLRFLLARAAEREEVETPVLEPDAAAGAWRQDWPGNLRALEALATRLVLLRAGEPVAARHLAEAAAECGRPWRARLPSRHPPREELVAALRDSATLGGRLNKTAAAQLLGWDPDTLVARMSDHGLGVERSEELPALDGWSARTCPAPAASEAEEGRAGLEPPGGA